MITNTRQALEGLTDPALFEKIATAILKNASYPELIHAGLNAAGKTIPSPIDGIAFVGISNEHLLLVAHTTTGLTDLKGKWLDDPDVGAEVDAHRPARKVGDLVKCLRYAKTQRKSRPSLRVTVVLTTNMQPGEGLISEVFAVASNQNVKVDIWSCSRIADELDLKGAGQYVRKKYLGSAVELLSSELMREIGDMSIASLNQVDDECLRVERELDRQLDAASGAVTFVIGESGAGKTIACLKALRRHSERGGISLVIPCREIEAMHSLNQMVMSVLTAYHPGLDASHPPLEIVSKGTPALFLIEEIGGSKASKEVLEKLTLMQQACSSVGIRILCPIQPHSAHGVDPRVRDKIYEHSIYAKDFNRSEAIEAVKVSARQAAKKNLTSFEAESIAEALGYNPLLIGLNRRWQHVNPGRVIQEFLSSSLAQAEEQSRYPVVLAPEFGHALNRLALAMLERSNLAPTLDEVRDWKLGNETLEAIKQLLVQKKLISLLGPKPERMVFRHERVRQALVCNAALTLYQSGGLNDEILQNALHAEAVAQVIVRAQAPNDLVDRCVSKSPAVLFHALRLGSLDGPSALRIANSAKAWASKIDPYDRGTLNLRYECCALIQGIRAPFMLELMRSFPPEWPSVMLANVRNGDLGCAIDYCGRRTICHAFLLLSEPLRAAYNEDRSGLIAEFDKMVDAADGEPERIRGIAVLAGVLAKPELQHIVSRLWVSAGRHFSDLSAFVWASAMVASTENAPTLLGEVCTTWVEVSAQKNPQDDDERRAGRKLCDAFAVSPPLTVLSFLVEYESDGCLDEIIELWLSGVDQTDLVEYHVQREARRIEQKYPRVEEDTATGFWNRRAKHLSLRMSEGFKRALEAIWNSETSASKKIAAFLLWCPASGPEDLPLLRDYNGADPLTDLVLIQRSILRDVLAAIPLVAQLEKGGNELWFLARFIWSSELCVLAEHRISRLAESKLANPKIEVVPDEELIRALAFREPAVAKEALRKYWDLFGDSTQFILAALLVGDDLLLAKLDGTLSKLEDRQKPFRQLSGFFGIDQERCPASEEAFLALKPYISFMSDQTLHQIANACNRRGLYDLRRYLIDPHMGEPAPGMAGYIEAMLNRNLRDVPFLTMREEVSVLHEAGQDWEDLMETVRGWLKTRPEKKALETVAQLVEIGGHLSDLSVLMLWPGSEYGYLEAVIADTRYAICGRGTER